MRVADEKNDYSQRTALTLTGGERTVCDIEMNSKTVVTGNLLVPNGSNIESGIIVALLGEVSLEELSVEELVKLSHLDAADQDIDRDTDSFRFAGLTPGVHTILALAGSTAMIKTGVTDEFSQFLEDSLFAAVVVNVVEGDTTEVDLVFE